MQRLLPALGLASGLALSATPAVASDAPFHPRVMSTNLCADVLLLGLADPRQIVAVSHKSQDPQRSSVHAAARRFAATAGSVEEVLALKPDIVLASRRWAGHHQQRLLAEQGIAVVTISFPSDWAGLFALTENLAERIGRRVEGRAVVADARQRIARLQAQSRPLEALYLRPNGGSAGLGTHVDMVFTAAGLRNQQGARGRRGWGRIALEEIIANPPQAFVLSSSVNDRSYARAGFSRHPRLQALLASATVLHLDSNDWSCSTWQLVEAAETLATQLQAGGS